MIPPVRVAFALLALAAGADEGSRFVGTWKGDLDAGARTLPFAFHLRLDEQGALTGTLDSPGEDLYGLPISQVDLGEGGSIAIRLRIVGARFEAALSEDGKALEGHWKQRGASIALRCARAEPERAERVPGQEKLAGTWEGALEVRGTRLRLVFHLREEPGGRIAGTLDSPDQGALDLPIGKVEFAEDGAVTLRIGVVGGTYEGKLDAAGKALSGTWKQAGTSLPLDLSRTEKPAERRRPQLPKPPYPYRVEEVAFPNERDGFTLAGTLTLPSGEGPHPAALLITGSGPQDRDETVFDHKPFAVIADALTRRGIVVLRVDDRGVGGSGGDASRATSLDFARDVEAGLDCLKGRPEVDPSRVGLLGHSEGGLIAPLVAARRDDVAFVVLLAGPAIDGERILLRQAELLARAAGSDEEAVAENRRVQERIFAILKDEALDEAEATRWLRAILAESSDAPEGEARDDFVAAQLGRVDSPWLRFFLAHDPAPALEKLRCPVLALFGEKDLQVPAPENAAVMRAALERGKNRDAAVAVLPGLNHLFQPCETGGIGEYVEIETTFEEGALGRIGDWIVERFGKK